MRPSFPSHAPSRSYPFKLLSPLLVGVVTLLAFALLPTGARAAVTWHVNPESTGVCTHSDPTCATIKAAVDAAFAGDTIQVAAGVYTQVIVIDKTLTLNGAGVGSTIISAPGPAVNITGGEVKISGMTISGGTTRPGGFGGSVFITAGDVTLSFCSLSDNFSRPNFDDIGGSGGAITNDGKGRLTLEWCRVASNTVRRGAAGVTSRGPLVITRTVIENNTSGGGAGGVDYSSELTMTGSVVLNNKSVGGFGGGLFGGGQTTIADSTISNNTAAFGAGGIFGGGPMEITRSVISGNKMGDERTTSAGFFGAGISVGTLTITNSVVSDNVGGIGSTGGGIASGSGTLTVTNCLITRNKGVVKGGGIVSSGTLVVTNSTISHNSSLAGDGGGISAAGTATISDSSVVNNTAVRFGSGIHNGGGTVTLNNSTVSNNTAAERGCGISNHGTFRVNNSALNNNNNCSSGGAVYNTGVLAVTNSTLSGNSSLSRGGGLFNEGTADFVNSTLTANQSGSTLGAGSGGGILNTNGTVRLKNTIVAGNSVVGGPGPDLAGAFTSQGNNLVGNGADATGLTNGTAGDIVGTSAAPVDPKLFPVGNYGGTTQTFALRPGSPALDAGDDSVLSAPSQLTTDQRGLARKVGSRVDIGSVESDGTDSEAVLLQFAAPAFAVAERGGQVTVAVRRTGPVAPAASVEFATADNFADAFPPCAHADGNASSRCDYGATLGTLRFAPGEDLKTFTVIVNDDAFAEGKETARLTLSNPTGGSALGTRGTAALEITDDQAEAGANTLDDPANFVRQQYHDFLAREPDTPGHIFWAREILSCGADMACAEVKRINVSGAFFLSIELQQTGYLVERIYKAAFGDAVGTSTLGGTHQLAVPIIRLEEFVPDMQRISQGVVVLQQGWEAQLESNKTAFVREFVQRERFTVAFPASMTPTQYVDQLNQRAGNPLDTTERENLIAELSSNNTAAGRASVLRKVAEDPTLEQAERNRAFVLMQYFGYLRRNPNSGQDADYTGYDFWLGNLERFNGDFVLAELVKAFISSDEYRQRFGL